MYDPDEEPSSVAANHGRTNDMVTTLKVGNAKAQLLFDTGTTGRNLIAITQRTSPIPG